MASERAISSLRDPSQPHAVDSSITSGQTLSCWLHPSLAKPAHSFTPSTAAGSSGHSGSQAGGGVPASYPKLDRNLEGIDVCIIGGGLTGLSVAYECVTSGLSVVVLEDGRIGSGESSRTSAHLSTSLDDLYYQLIKMHGAQKAKLVAESLRRSIERVEEIVKAEDIHCQFERVPGFLMPNYSEEDAAKKAAKEDWAAPEDMLHELSAARECGLSVTLVENGAPLNQHGSVAEGTRPAIRFPHQATFQPVHYLNGLAAAVIRRGGQLYCDTRAAEWKGGVGPLHTRVITTSGHTIHAAHIVLATNAPMGNRVALNDRLLFKRTYYISARIKKGALPHCCIWDMGEPSHQVRISSHPRSPNQRNDFESSGLDADSAGQAGSTPHNAASAEEEYDYILISGGEDHPVGEGHIDHAERFKHLESWARERWEFGAVDSRWSGQVLEPIDYLPYTGHNLMDESNVWIHTGGSGLNGVSNSVMAGMLLRDLIMKKSNPLAEVYTPSRLPPRAWLDYLKHNASANLHYFRYLKKRDDDDEHHPRDIEDLVPGEGTVRYMGGQHVAVYKRPDGSVTRHSAICPHMNGIVCWNPLEKSFDCPVHGSRFDAQGKLLMGPAKSDLRCIDGDRAQKAEQQQMQQAVERAKKEDDEKVKLHEQSMKERSAKDEAAAKKRHEMIDS